MTKIAKSVPQISVVVPCLNERYNLAGLLRLMSTATQRFGGEVEVIVVDGGSTDQTVDWINERVTERAEFSAFSKVCVERCDTSRAVQMNRGASVAKGALLYFVHADTRPPLDCLVDVWRAHLAGHQIGGFAFDFDSDRRILAFNSWLTTFNTLSFRGGDQSIFVARDLFDQLGGYDESMVLMEEYGLLRAACRAGVGYHLMPGRTLVSDRKYASRSWARVQVANICAVAGWRTGRDTRDIRRLYERMLTAGKP